MSDLHCTAIHEAGHAVMVCRLGRRIQRVTIVPEVVQGVTRYGGVHAEFPVTSKEEAHDLALYAWAGYAACRVRGVRNLGYLDDALAALTELDKWESSPEVINEECRTLSVEKMGEPKNKAAVERLASLLLERLSLDGEAVLSCIAQSDADLER